MNNTIWLIVFVILLVVEALTAGLTTIWFAGGALLAFFAAGLGFDLVVQAAVFIFVSLALLFFTRPLAIKLINRKTVRTNKPDAILGRTAIVTEEISELKASGKIEIDGMPWTARCETPGAVIPAGEEVTVLSVSGVKCIVEKKSAE